MNLSNEVDAEEVLLTSSELFILRVINPILLCIGVIANGAFLFAVIKVKRLHTVTNYYLFNLAIADIVFIAYPIGIYFALVLLTPVRNDYPMKSCWVTFWISVSCYFASTGIVTSVTLERYLAICKPLHHRSINTKSRTIKILIFNWISSLALSGVVVCRWSRRSTFCVIWPDLDKYKDFPTTVSFCVPSIKEAYVLAEILQSVPFLIALFASTFMYYKIIRSLSDRNIVTKGDSNYQTSQAVQANLVRNQVCRMLIINGSLFFLCQLLQRVLSAHFILEHLTGSGFFTLNQYGFVLLASRACLFLNSLANPFIYTATSGFYRQAFREAFCGVTKKKLERSSTISSKI